jgi:hypothetical protein
MGRADEYRWFAARCLQVAQSTSNRQTKATMLQMAQVWSRLADEIKTAARHAGDPGAEVGAVDPID